jgi:hypothetical protein
MSAEIITLAIVKILCRSWLFNCFQIIVSNIDFQVKYLRSASINCTETSMTVLNNGLKGNLYSDVRQILYIIYYYQ